MDPRELLGMIAFFSEALNDDEIFALARGAKQQSYPAGGVIVREDDHARGLFVIESGQVKITVAGEAEPLATLFAGDFFGEMALLTGQPANATVTAVEPVIAYEISPNALAPVLAEAPALDERLAATMVKRQGELDHLYGNPMWGQERLGKAEILDLIRKFYERA